MAADMGLTLDELFEQEPAMMAEKVKQIETALEGIDFTAPPSPRQPVADQMTEMEKERRLCEQVLRYQLNHPDAKVPSAGGTTYSDGFIRFILQRFDSWEGSQEEFCDQVEVPYKTLCAWIEKENYR